MRPDEPMDRALRDVAEEHARKLKKRLKRAAKGDPDGVHDGRTALRRMRIDLELMGRTVFDPDPAGKLEARLHDLERALAKARDSDVMLARLDRYARVHPTAKDALAPLTKRLQKRRANGVRDAHDLLVAGGGKSTLRDVQAFVAAPPSRHDHGDGPRAEPRLVRHFTHDEVWHRYEQLRAFDARVLDDPDELHKYRSACRSLRYALEVFEGALPKVHVIVDELRALQDQIGTMHDHHVAAALVDKWVQSGKLRPSPELEEYVGHELRARDATKERFETRWLKMLGGQFRARLAEALEDEGQRAA